MGYAIPNWQAFFLSFPFLPSAKEVAAGTASIACISFIKS